MELVAGTFASLSLLLFNHARERVLTEEEFIDRVSGVYRTMVAAIEAVQKPLQ